MLHYITDLVTRHSRPRMWAASKHLPQQHSKRPDIGGRRETVSISETFWSQPTDHTQFHSVTRVSHCHMWHCQHVSHMAVSVTVKTKTWNCEHQWDILEPTYRSNTVPLSHTRVTLSHVTLSARQSYGSVSNSQDEDVRVWVRHSRATLHSSIAAHTWNWQKYAGPVLTYCITFDVLRRKSTHQLPLPWGTFKPNSIPFKVESP